MSRFPGSRQRPADAIGGPSVEPPGGREPTDTGVESPAPTVRRPDTAGVDTRIVINLERSDWLADRLPDHVRAKLSEQIAQMKERRDRGRGGGRDQGQGRDPDVLTDGGTAPPPEPEDPPPEPGPIPGDLRLIVEVTRRIPPISTGNVTVRPGETPPDPDASEPPPPITAFLTDDVDIWEMDLGDDPARLISAPDFLSWGYVDTDGYHASARDAHDDEPDVAIIEAQSSDHPTRQTATITATWRLVSLRVVDWVVSTGQVATTPAV